MSSVATRGRSQCGFTNPPRLERRRRCFTCPPWSPPRVGLGRQVPRLHAARDPIDQPSGSSRKELGDSLTVEQRTLTPLVKVRILVPQPTKSRTYKSHAPGLVLFAG